MILWLSVALGAEIRLSTDAPVEGEPVQVTVVDAAELVVTYRPGSAVEATQTLQLDPGGTAQWVPAQPGLAVLAAGTASRPVSVRFSGVPWNGVLVFLVAGGLLFGGIGFAFSRLMRGGAATPPIVDT